MNRWKHIAFGALVAGPLVVGASIATAASPPTDPPDTITVVTSAPPSSGPNDSTTGIPAVRLAALCERVPGLLRRTDRLLERLDGDVDTRGSIMWLQARLDDATQAGRDAQVTVLTNRLRVREAQLALLGDRREMLIELRHACDNVDA